MQDAGRNVLRCLVLAGAFLLTTTAPAFAAADDDRLARLEPEKREQAEFLNAFADEMDRKYFGRVARMNGGLADEQLNVSTEWSIHDVRATRGEVMQKAGRLYAMGKKQRPDRGGREILWSRFYALDMHPKSPLVGMLHAAIVLEFYGDGSELAGGWIDIMPGTRVAEDLDLLNRVTTDYFAAQQVDLAIYRRLVCKGTADTVAAFRRQPACVGASFYGPPLYPGNTDKSIRFIAGLYDAFVGSYMDIVEKRAHDKFTQADVQAQDAMRKRWLMDQFFSDPYSSVEIPFEVVSLWNQAPVVKF